MPYRGDLAAILTLFMGAEGEVRVADLTKDVCRASYHAIFPATLWAMPVHQLLFLYFKPPNRAESEPDIVDKVIQGNIGKEKPFIPRWLFAKKESADDVE